MDDNHLKAFLAYTDYDPEFVEAERYLAKALGVELDDDEHFGDDWVLQSEDWILERCRKVVDSHPKPVVLDALVKALRGSYHLKVVHDLMAEIARQATPAWRAGDRSVTQRSLVRDVAQAYSYGTKPADLDFVLEMCDEPTFKAAGDGDEEDFRRYWFDALTKIKDARVTRFARDIARKDVGEWTDDRIVDALRILGKTWDPVDAELFAVIAQQHTDSEVRRDAKRILKRHSH